MTEPPIAFEAYEQLAEAYASAIDRKPHNAFYERPATLSLLPEIRGKKVLDAGCGPGVYTEWLTERGAEVTALDASPRMIELAKRRVGDRAAFRVANLAAPLDFLDDRTFDLVLSSLVLDYVRDWDAAFREFRRLLVPGGHLVFSVGHPLFDYAYFRSNKYFETEQVSAEWRGFPPVRVQMPAFRRSLQDAINPLLEAGFCLERLLEPRPTDEFRSADPRHYEELMQQPCFLCIRARADNVI